MCDGNVGHSKQILWSIWWSYRQELLVRFFRNSIEYFYQIELSWYKSLARAHETLNVWLIKRRHINQWCCVCKVYFANINTLWYLRLPAWHYLFTMIEWIERGIDAACKMINAAQNQLYSGVQQVANQFTQRKSMLGTKNGVICAAGRHGCSLLLW